MYDFHPDTEIHPDTKSTPFKSKNVVGVDHGSEWWKVSQIIVHRSPFTHQKICGTYSSPFISDCQYETKTNLISNFK